MVFKSSRSIPKHKNRGFEKAAPVFVFWDAK